MEKSQMTKWQQICSGLASNHWAPHFHCLQNLEGLQNVKSPVLKELRSQKPGRTENQSSTANSWTSRTTFSGGRVTTVERRNLPLKVMLNKETLVRRCAKDVFATHAVPDGMNLVQSVPG